MKELEEKVKVCNKCNLFHSRNKVVFGEGDINSKLMFIGEGPGKEEDLTGRPFVGRAGQVLIKVISELGYKREDFYICNICKCRAANDNDVDRPPTNKEKHSCIDYLYRQIELINPRVIITLGNTPTQYLLFTTSTISNLRGIWHKVDFSGIRTLIPTYHPSYILRNGCRGQSYENFVLDIKMGIELSNS